MRIFLFLISGFHAGLVDKLSSKIKTGFQALIGQKMSLIFDPIYNQGLFCHQMFARHRESQILRLTINETP